MRLLSKSLSLATATALALLATRCGGDNGGGSTPTGPVTISDPAGTAAKIDALDDAFDTPAYHSYSLALNYAPFSFGAVARLADVVRPDGGATLARARTAEHLRQLLPRTGPRPTSVLPPEALGKTYEWSTSTGGYIQTTRAGAPANGARFILYELDPGTGLPSVDPLGHLTEIGYADLIDLSTPTTDKLHIVVVVGGTQYVNYVGSCSFTETTLSETVVGSVTDGQRQLDFNTTAAFAYTPDAITGSYDSHLDVNADDVHVRFRFDYSFFSTANYTFNEDLSVQVGTQTLVLSGTYRVTDGTTSGDWTVTVNGGVFARITYVDGAYTYSGADHALTAEEQNALLALFQAFTNIYTVLGELEIPLPCV